MAILVTNAVQVARFANALYGIKLGSVTNAAVMDDISAVGLTSAVNSYYTSSFGSATNASVAETILGNLGLAGNTAAKAYVEGQLNAAGNAKGAAVLSMLNAFSNLTSDATFGAAATAWNDKITAARAYTVAYTDDVTVDYSAPVTGKTFTLTTGVDAITGTSADDVINGGLVDMTTAANTTYTSSDEVSGGAGNDTLKLTLSGTDASTDVPTAVVVGTITGVETVRLTSTANASGFADTNAIDLTRASGITTLQNYDSTEALSVTGLKTNATIALSNVSANTTVAYTSAVVLTGTSDVLNVTVDSSTAGTLKVANGFETINIASSGSANTITDIDADGDGTTDSVTKIVVTGGTALTVTNAINAGTMNVNLATVDASAMTAALTLTLDTGDLSIVGGSGNDVITAAATLTAADTINGGSGVDTLKVTDADTIDTAAEVANISSIERLEATANDTTSFDASLMASLTTLKSSSAGAANTVTFSKLGSNITNLEIAGTEGMTVTKATDTDSDSITLTVGSSSAGYTVDATDGAFVANDYETINLVSNGGANVLNNVSASDLTTLNVTGSKAMTWGDSNDAFSYLTSIDASAMTADFKQGSTSATTAAKSTGVTILGGSGNDTLVGAAGNDSITSGSGNDSITSNAGNDTIDAGAGNDTITTGDGNDVVTAGDGVDAITGGSGMDNLSGGAGNDTFTVAEQADFVSTTGAIETVAGGDGVDTLSFADSASNLPSLSADSLLGLSGIEIVQFLDTDGAASITLTDAVYTANGNATLTIDADVVTSGAITVSASTLTSANAVKVDLDTNCVGGAASHNIVLGAGNDTVIAELDDLDTSALTITGGSGTDTLQITDAGDTSGTSTSITLDDGITGFETITFTTATDTYNITTDGANVASGATLTVSGSSLTTGVLYFSGAAETTGKFAIYGGGGDDSLVGGSGADTISGGSGGDTLTGGAGNDSIDGGSQNDNISAGSGVDTIIGGDGEDTIDAGAGIDSIDGGADNDTINVSASADFVGLTSAETVAGGAGNDTLSFATSIAFTINSTDLNLSSIETIQFLSTGSDISLTLTDAVMAANGNATVTIDADTMTSGALTISAGTVSSSYALKVDLDTNCVGGAASHNIVLGAGNDTVIAELDDLDTSALTITGGSGTDTLQITDAGDTSGTSTSITLDDGITGFETITFTTASDTYNITTNSATVASGVTMTVSGAALTGVLYFDGSAETNGYFNILSGGGADSITGGTLADTISSGSGADTITGGLGADSITGGAGNDVFVYANVSQSGGTSVDTITDWTSAADKLQVSLDYSTQSAALDINAVRLGAGAAALSNIQDGLSGKRGEYQYNIETSQLVINFNADNLITASDYKIGLAAGSTASATVADGDINFSITGGSGADSIVAGGGADTIIGGSGADTIKGGSGNDSITLGASSSSDSAADVLVFESTGAGNGSDTITGLIANSDVLNFYAFFGTGVGAGLEAVGGAFSSTISAFTSGDTGDIAIANKVVTYSDASYNGNTTTTIVAALIEGSSDAFALAASGKAIIITGDDSGANDAIQIWFIDNALDGASTISATDVKLVGTSAAAIDLDTLTASNFAFTTV